MLDQVLGALDELTPRGAGAEHFREVGIVEDVAEKRLWIAGDPAVTLRNRALGVDGDELAGAIFLPNIFHESSILLTVRERFSGKAISLPSFLPLISPEETSQPMSADRSPNLTW